MKKRYEKPLTLEELALRPEQEIDYSDIPELDENFWSKANLSPRRSMPNISLRLPEEVLEFFKGENPRGYTSQMAAVLTAYAKAHKKDGGTR